MIKNLIDFLQSSIFDRLLNRHTKKGLSQLVVALILGSTGLFSEKFIETMVFYEWTFVEDFVSGYKPYIIASAIFFGLLAGYNLFRREFEKINLRLLKTKLEEALTLVGIKKAKFEEEQIELEREKIALEREKIALERKKIELETEKIDLELGGFDDKTDN